MKRLHLGRRVCMACIRGYQKHISPLFPPVCRYTPTCSQYTLEAIGRFGAIRGIHLGTLRILRCNPFSKGGWDPVPLEFDFFGRHRIPQPDPLSTAQRRALDEFGWRLAPRTRFLSGNPHFRSAGSARNPEDRAVTPPGQNEPK